MGETPNGDLCFCIDLSPRCLSSIQASGSYIESFTSRNLRQDEKAVVDPEQEDVVKWCAGGLYAGSADTVVILSYGFIH